MTINSISDAVANSLVEMGIDREFPLRWPSMQTKDEKSYEVESIERIGNVIQATYYDVDGYGPALEITITVEVREVSGEG